MLTTNNIITQKHARVFISGDIEKANEIWLLFHGYAQNVEEFFEPFESFIEDKCFIIPEGLSRFYQKGIFGKVGASWMTSEERELEIIDQAYYLDQVFSHYNLHTKTLNIFAFSQGAMTAARWIENSKIKTNRLVFWSGNIPDEIASNKENWVNQQSPEFYVGKNDQFAPIETWYKFFNKAPFYKPVFHDGNHFFTNQELNDFIFNS